jgi:alpha-glucosidase (family GH31 glycosyl hydrolase)
MDRFSFPASPAAKHNVFKTKHMRITVLTSCLIRLESGNFTDLPTQTVWNRVFPKVSCTWGQENGIFTIKTEECRFRIDVSGRRMLSITMKDGTVVKDFEKGNLLGTARTLDMVNGSVKLEKGIMSRSGVAVLDDSSSLLLDEKGVIQPRAECRDLYYFAYGSDYRRCLRDFFRLTGPVPLIPKYALGNWWSRYKAYTQEEYRQLMQQFISRKLPVTVATIDMDWHWTDVLERFGKDAAPGKGVTVQEKWYNANLPGWTGYSWNRELFPDHGQLLSWLKEQGFHVTLNVHPSQGIRPFEDCYQNMAQAMGYDPREGRRIPFDIADPKFTAAYFDQVHHPLEKEGVDFWWIDWQQGKVTSVPGLDPLWALNHYHTLDACSGEKRPLILSRYAGLGSHRYPLGFSGDTFATWDSLHFQPYFTNTAANAGYTWWSHDIGGHQFGVQDDELYVRWLQYGVFSPINRLHSCCNEHMGKEPWKRSFAANAVAEKFLRLRHQLIPYLYSANYRTHTQGEPLCAPMYYDYDREEAYRAKNQYIFGGSLLVCPVTTPADKKLNLAKTTLWLPEGRWTDFFTDRIYQGGRWIDMFRDLDTIPVLAREGAIVPMYRNAESNDLSLDQPLEIHIWRGNGAFELYEDDGETQRENSLITRLEVEETENSLIFRIRGAEGDLSLVPQKRQMRLRFRDVESAELLVNGQPMDYRTDGIDLCVDTREGATIRLDRISVLRNVPKEQLKTGLLTRIQGEIIWKNAVLTNEKKMPKAVREALAELDTLEY